MTHGLRRALEATAGLGVTALAVFWLSGGCEQRVAPGEAQVAERALPETELAAVDEVVEPGFEWASGAVASARQTAVAARVLARIEEVRVRAGSSVSEGEVVVVLDARDLRARVGEAEEALRSSEARLALAESEAERTQELFRTGVAPQRRVDEVTASLRATEAEVAGRKEALAEAKTAASFAELRSPVAGRVVDRLAEPGDTALPGQPLLRIYDPSLLRVEAPVRESLAVRLSVGDVLTVEVPALGESVEGRIDEIVPFAERGARTLLVKVVLPRSDARLFAGLFARVAIPAETRTRLLIPERAVDRVGQLEFVTVAGEAGLAERRLVTTGGRPQPGRIEILSGLRPGERVWLGSTSD
jgi:RND family efflux transporter MFP subunit